MEPSKRDDIYKEGAGIWIMNLNRIKSEHFSNAFKIFWEGWKNS